MMEKAGRNRDDYKKSNRGAVLRMIVTGSCANRVELVEHTGLSKMTITNIVGEMIESGILSERIAARSGDPGRRPRTLTLSEDAPRVIGLLILRDRVEAVLCGLDLRVCQRERMNYVNTPDKKQLIQLVFGLIDTLLLGAVNVCAIGIASIGPISVREGRILNPYYFYDIQDVEIVRLVRERYGLPVYFDHDNQSAVLAESLFGNGRGYGDILLIGGSQGIGCGIVSSSNLNTNTDGLSPEIGHLSINYAGRRCVCGSRGCLEGYINSQVLLELMQQKTGKYYNYETFCRMSNDPAVDEVLTEAADRLGIAIISVINILNSELVLLSDNFVHWDDRYLLQLEKRVNEERFTKWARHILVKKTYFRDDSPLMGSACNAVKPIFDGEVLFE